MKFIHTADIHLGAAFLEKNQLFESFERIIEDAKNEKVDVLMISGDLFNKQPLLKELREINALFSRIGNTKVFIIAGNHDFIKKDSYYNSFNWNENVIFIKGNKISRIDVDKLNLSIYGMSYHNREIRENIYDNLTPDNEERINILMAHGGDETHGPINFQSLNDSGFDYIALGHIHKYSEPINNYAIYPGSIEPLDINETGAHGYVYGEITKTGRLIEFRSIAKKRCIHYELDVTGKDSNFGIIEELKKIIDKDAYYKINLIGKSKIDLNLGLFYNIKNVVKVVDNTSLDYDIDKLLKDNENGILGEYIKNFVINNISPSEIEKKSNEYAIKALIYNQKGN